jgi:hypothetical protein
LKDNNLVVAMTGADDHLNTRDMMMPHILQTIVSTVKSDEPLPANPDGAIQLEAVVNAAANPQVQAVRPLPPIGGDINGKVFFLANKEILFPTVDRMLVPDGDWGVVQFGLEFGENEATLSLKTVHLVDFDVPVGLDGVYRVTASPIGTLAAKGSWATDTTFILCLRYIESARVLRYTLTFFGRSVAGWAEVATPLFGEDLFNGGSTWVWGDR